MLFSADRLLLRRCVFNKKTRSALPPQLAVDILQIPVSVVFGYFIDLTMYLLFWVEPQGYAVKLVALVAGCIVLGFGVYLEVLADVVMLPGESFVRAVVQVWHTNFGTTKIVFDSSMTVIAALFRPAQRRSGGHHHRVPSGGLFRQSIRQAPCVY